MQHAKHRSSQVRGGGKLAAWRRSGAARHSGSGTVAAAVDPVEIFIERARQGDAEAIAMLGGYALEPEIVEELPTPAPIDGQAPRLGALRISKADFTVNSLLDKVLRGKLNLRPTFQREYVWEKKTASRLIESLLLNVPVPTLFFHETESGILEVVDGKQRLTSIHSFVTGKFPDGKQFVLAGLDVFPELNGNKFTDLNEQQQETIKDYALNVHTIMKDCEPEFVFEVFERLNMGSTQLNEQELRNCIYQGPYTQMLTELSCDENMLYCLNTTKPHLRMRDCEMILRFFAMQRTGPEGFSIPAKAWLNNELRLRRDLTSQQLQGMKENFSGAISLARDVFDKDAFRPVKIGTDDFVKGEVNIAIWDTVMYTFASADPQNVRDNAALVKLAFVELAGSSAFCKLMVSNPRAVLSRHEAWHSTMQRILSRGSTMM